LFIEVEIEAGSAAFAIHPLGWVNILVVFGHWEGACLAAGDERISRLTSGTAADGEMSLGLATGAGGAFANARIDTLIVDARPVIRALVVAETFTLQDNNNYYRIYSLQNLHNMALYP